jgi:hypothetical protein
VLVHEHGAKSLVSPAEEQNKSIRNIIEVDALVSEYQTFNVNAVKKRGLGLSDIRLNSSRVE